LSQTTCVSNEPGKFFTVGWLGDSGASAGNAQVIVIPGFLANELALRPSDLDTTTRKGVGDGERNRRASGIRKNVDETIWFQSYLNQVWALIGSQLLGAVREASETAQNVGPGDLDGMVQVNNGKGPPWVPAPAGQLRVRAIKRIDPGSVGQPEVVA
jgi:hypothetical protein